MPDTILPNPAQQEHSFEPREVTVAGEENPQKKFDEQASVIDMYKMQEFFNLSQPTFKEKEVLTNIYQYFNNLNLPSREVMFSEILNVEKKLGHTPLGQTRLNHLWNYLKILSQINQYDDLRNSMERN